jgi:hypothetical protein
MYRVRRLFRYLSYRVATSHVATTLLRNVLLGFYTVHIGACLFWFIARQVRGRQLPGSCPAAAPRAFPGDLRLLAPPAACCVCGGCGRARV